MFLSDMKKEWPALSKGIPTPEGVRRYPDTAGYFFPFKQVESPETERIGCTCLASCAEVCFGECDCPACKAQYVQFLRRKMPLIVKT